VKLKTWCAEHRGRQVEVARSPDLVVTKDFSRQGTGLLLVGNPAEVKKRHE
jgi:hypothetical protein